MGAIDINARYLNVNGTVQSGVDSIELTIDENFAPTSSVNFTDSSGKLRTGIRYGADGLASVDGYFNVDKGLIVLRPIKPTGGVINLTGTIVSTGNGHLKVASGYASVKIDNKSQYQLAIDTVDVSENRVGKITITDSETLRREVFTVANGKWSTEVRQGQAVTSGGATSINYNTVVSTTTNREAKTTAAGYSALYYNPVAGRYYTWTEGQAMTQTEVYTYEERSFNLIGFNWDFLSPDSEAKDVSRKFTDGTPLLESEVITVRADMANAPTLLVDYMRRANPAVELIKNKSLVRDVVTNKLYEYVGDTGNVTFPVANFTDTGKWKFVEQMSGGKRSVLGTSVIANPTDPTKWLYYFENQQSNRVKRADGTNWEPEKTDYKLDSTFNNQEITIKGPTKTGGGWLRETVITTVKTTVTGLKDFYTYSLRADRPIEISAFTGTTAPTVDIKTTGTLQLLSNITFDDTLPDSEAEAFKPLALSADALEVSGTALFSGALPDIKANSDVIIKVKDPRGRLNVQAAGNIRVEQVQGRTNTPIKVGSVVAATFQKDGQALPAGSSLVTSAGVSIRDAYDVEVIAVNGILGLGSAANFVGASIQLDGGKGDVIALIDSAVLGSGGFAGRALGTNTTISVKETAFDLNLIAPTAWVGLVSVEASGDVNLEAKAGAIRDAWFERFVPNARTAQTNLAKSGATDATLELSGLGTAEQAADRAQYALSPDLIAVLMPHEPIGNQGAVAAEEKLNVKGANVVLAAFDASNAPASIGRVSDRVTIANPMNFNSLSAGDKALLAQASAQDVVDLSFKRYIYRGTGVASVDLSDPSQFLNPGLWELADSLDVMPNNLPLLASTQGLQDVAQGQWVENRRELVSVTLQIVQDIDIAALGNVTIKSQGGIAVRAESDIRINEGTVSGLTIKGIEATESVWLSAKGSIYVTGAGAASDTHIVSGGDLTLQTDGSFGTLKGAIGNTVAAGSLGALRIDLATKTSGGTTYRGVLKVDAAAAVHLLEQTNDMVLSSVQSRGTGADGNVTLSSLRGEIYRSGRAEDIGNLHVKGTTVSLNASLANDSQALGSIGAQNKPLSIDAELLNLSSQSDYSATIEVRDVNSLKLGTVTFKASDSAFKVSAHNDLVTTTDLSLDRAASVVLTAESGDLEVQKNIFFGENPLALSAGQAFRQKANSLIDHGQGVVTVSAGSFIQEHGSELTTREGATGGASITLNIVGDVVVSKIDANAAALAINSTTGRILEALGVAGLGDSDADLIAGSLTLSAGNGVGRLGRYGEALEISANSLNATVAQGDFAVTALNSLTVNNLVVGTAGVAPALSTSKGSLVLVLSSGGLTVAGDVVLHGTGNLLLQTLSATGDITLGSATGKKVAVDRGALSILSGRALSLNNDVLVTVTNGSVDLEAFSGSITMAAGAMVDASGYTGPDALMAEQYQADDVLAGNVRLAASHDIALAQLKASQTGTVSLRASAGQIWNVLSDKSLANVTGAQLRLQSGSGIGVQTVSSSTTQKTLWLEVGRLSAHSTSGDIRLENKGALEIGPVFDIRSDRVVSTGLLAPIWDVAQSGVVAAGASSGVFIKNTGSLTLLSDPALDGGYAIRAGTGGITLDMVNGASGSSNLAIHGRLSTTGNISVKVGLNDADDSLTPSGSITLGESAWRQSLPVFVADTLFLRAQAYSVANPVTNVPAPLRMAVNTLDVIVGTGDLVLIDEALGVSDATLMVTNAVTGTGALSLSSSGAITLARARVGSGKDLTIEAGGNLALTLSESLGSLASGTEGQQILNLSLAAAGFISGSRFFLGSASTKYRSATALRFSDTADSHPENTAIIDTVSNFAALGSSNIVLDGGDLLSISGSKLPQAASGTVTLRAREGILVSSAAWTTKTTQALQTPFIALATNAQFSSGNEWEALNPQTGGATLGATGAATAPSILSLPSSLVISSGVLSSLAFTGADLDDGNVSADESLVLTLGVTTGVLSATSGGGVAVGGSNTARTLTGTASALETFLQNGSVTYNGSASGLSITLARESAPTGAAITATAALQAVTQTTGGDASAALVLPAVVTTPGAMVSIPFGSQALVASGPVTLTFTPAGTTLDWDITAATGLTLTPGASNSVSLSGTPEVLNTYLAAGKLKVGGSGTVTVSGAVTGTISVTAQSNIAATRTLPTLTLPETFTVPPTGGNLTFASSAFGTSTTATRTVLISSSVGGVLNAAIDPLVGVTTATTGTSITLTGTETALSTYLATVGKLTFTGAAGSYTLTVTVQEKSGSTVVAATTKTANVSAVGLVISLPTTLNVRPALETALGTAGLVGSGQTLVMGFGAEFLTEFGTNLPVEVTLRSTGATLSWSASSIVRNGPSGTFLSSSTGNVVTLFGSASEITSYLSTWANVRVTTASSTMSGSLEIAVRYGVGEVQTRSIELMPLSVSGITQDSFRLRPPTTPAFSSAVSFRLQFSIGGNTYTTTNLSRSGDSASYYRTAIEAASDSSGKTLSDLGVSVTVSNLGLSTRAQWLIRFDGTASGINLLSPIMLSGVGESRSPDEHDGFAADLGNFGAYNITSEGLSQGGGLSSAGAWQASVSASGYGSAGSAFSPSILSLPSSLVISSGVLSSLAFTGADLDDGNVSADESLVLTLGVTTGVLSATSGGGVAVGGSNTARTLTGTASALETFLQNGSVTYNGSASGLSITLARESAPTGAAITATAALQAVTQTTGGDASAALVLPAVVTTPGAMVSIPFGSQALVASGPVTLTFTPAGTTLDWDITAATGLTLTPGASNSVSLSGTPEVLNTYLAAGKLKVGGSGTVTVSGAVTGTISVTAQSNIAATRTLPTLTLPETFTVPPTGGNLTFASSAFGTSTTATRTVLISSSVGGVLNAAIDPLVGVTTATTGTSITLTGTETALSTYLATVG
ncbi:MAG: hypothetical protein FJY35_10075, partial [Betaproteobacteria bacterium]|nr:hypothetical protein [Betaproteobacteria bacterium]